MAESTSETQGLIFLAKSACENRYTYPASIIYKSTAGRYRPVRYPDGPITARYKFIKNAYMVFRHMGYFDEMLYTH